MKLNNNVTRITEARNPASMNIDKLEVQEILELINREDQNVITAVQKVIPAIDQAVEKISAGMIKGGRLIYIGAGTSGRIGVLDAVECMPTFSIEPERVIGIMAGGQEAMFVAQEGLEDDFDAGLREIQKYNLTEVDSLVGIAASGHTPYVMGAITEAKNLGATTISLTCTVDSPLEKLVDIAIAPVPGPEVLTGSTRMKAGTAQKLVLNMISTTVMIKLGKTYSNLMVDLKPSNHKLRERSKNIFMTITAAPYEVAEEYLEKSKFNLKAAIVMYDQQVSLEEALQMLMRENGSLARLIDQ